MSKRTLLEDLVAGTADDWSDAEWVYWMAVDQTGTPAEARDAALGAIDEALRRGLVVAGDVTAEGFRPWSATPEDSSARIREEWLALPDPKPEPDTICWLDVTPAGEEMAQQVYDREEAGA